MDRATAGGHRYRHLASLQQADLAKQDTGALGVILELPLAVVKPGIFELIGTATVEDGALAQDAVNEPALLQFERLACKGLSFVLVDGHGPKYMRDVTSLSRLLC